MPRTLKAHPSDAELRAFGLGELDPMASAEIERHVENCDQCCRVLQHVPDDTVLVKLKQSHTLSYATADSQPMLDRESDNGTIPAALRDHPRYRVLKVLGRGGMGVVYKAEHRLMERPVALKVISRRLISNPRAVERFQREVKLAARLTHPNIVVAHDAEQAGDLHFLVMEFVDGISLAQFVERKGPLPAPLASNFILQTARGLQAAARHGMVHRDIKPQNLMMTRKPEIKILDFGLARFASEEETTENESAKESMLAGGLTSADMILGTPDYMAPEQAEASSQADTRADIYSLGCTFFFLLAGQAPFAGDSVTRTLQSHIDRQPPSLRSLRPDLPPELVRIIERMMAKDPAARFQTPTDVINALRPFAPERVVSQWDSITVNRPTELEGFSATEGDEPPTTIELVRRRHWRTLWNRSRYELRKFFRLPHRRLAAGIIAVLLLIGTVAGLMEWSNRTTLSAMNQRPLASNNSTAAPSSPLKLRSETSKADGTRIAENKDVSSSKSTVTSPLSERHPRVALVITQTEFFPSDYPVVRRTLEARNALVTVVSSRQGWATPKGSEPGGRDDVWADLGIEDVRPGDFDAILFLPAGRPEFLAKEAIGGTVHRVIQEQYDHGACVGAVGNAVIVLADHGFLKGQRAVIQAWILESDSFKYLLDLGVDWHTQTSVVASGREGRLMTARSFGDAAEFVDRILETIAKKAKR